MQVSEFREVIAEYLAYLEDKRNDANVFIFVPALGAFMPFMDIEDLKVFFTFRIPEDD